MSEITGQLSRTLDAFNRPTLSLLHKDHAPVVVTILGECFSRESRLVSSARLHIIVEELLNEIRASGLDVEVPKGTGREVCHRWMNANWLIKSTSEDESESYSLTSHAQQALDFVATLRQERSGLTGHRIANIVHTARQLNLNTNPDKDARIAILEAEVLERNVELDRLRAGGDVEVLNEDRILEGFIELLNLVSQLPSDFKRVEESFRAVRAEIIDDFRAERRQAGQVIDRYLERIDNLMTATFEGRAFEGAFELLRSEELLQQLRSDIASLIEQGEDVLNENDRSGLREIVSLMRRGLEGVLDQRARISEVMRNYITSRDPNQDREFDRLMRQVESAFEDWLRTAGPRASIPIELLPGRVEVSTLRDRFFDASKSAKLPELDLSDAAGSPEHISLEELMQLGGPRMDVLSKHLDEAATHRSGDWTLGDIFDELPIETRRPVDLLGLLQLATDHPDLTTVDGNESYSTIRPDGTQVTFITPVLAPGDKDEEQS